MTFNQGCIGSIPIRPTKIKRKESKKMKVYELIEKLQSMSKSSKVFMEGCDCYSGIEDVRECCDDVLLVRGIKRDVELRYNTP